MKKIEVEIAGDALLMNSPRSMLTQDTKGISSATVRKLDFKAEAEEKTYRKNNGELYIPAEAVRGSLINGAKFKKVGKYSATSLMAAGIRIEPLEIGLGTKNYDIDIRTCVLNKKARIVRARPCIKDWKAKFTIVYNEKIIADPKAIFACLEDAGQRVGLLDFRPEKKGQFGAFEIKKFEAV